MTRPRRLLHADIDQMFVACARLADPTGAGKAELLLVGGTPEGRGVVTSASYPARRFGIRAGMPMARALRLCPGAMAVPIPGAVVRRQSRAVRVALERWTPAIETCSVDEHVLDLSGTEAIYREDLPATARRIRAEVLEVTGMTVSLGGGTNKLVAKMAADVAKPSRGGDGVHVVAPGQEAAFLASLALADIPGVGPKLQRRLDRFGLVQVTDALPLPVETLAERFGESVGRWLFHAVRGEDERELAIDGAPKSVSREETFPTDLMTDQALGTELARLAVRVAADLRAHGAKARTITVKLRDADFTTRQAATTLPDAVLSDRTILAQARPLLARLRKTRRTGARLLGIRLSGLVWPDTGAGTQLALFEAADQPGTSDTPADVTLAQVVDRINQKHGQGTITTGSALESLEQ
jgi:DNA polymerase-4